MKNISVHLQHLVLESLHPKVLMGQQSTSIKFHQCKQSIDQELDKLSIQISSSFFRDKRYRENLITGIFEQITELSNYVNGYLHKYSRIWNKHPFAKQFRQGYFLICLVFENFLDKLEKRFNKIAEEARITDFSLSRVKVELRLQLTDVRRYLMVLQVDDELNNVVINGLATMIDQRSLLRKHKKYLVNLMENLLNKKFSSAAELIDYLVLNDFNLPEFFLFCVSVWKDQLSRLDGLLEQKERLFNIKSWFFDLSLSKGLKSPFTNERLYDEINKFLTEKYAMVKERIKISRESDSTENLRPRAKRVLINLSVAQLALFIRLQVEKGILAKEHIGELFAFFARHFYTPNTDFISPDSLQKKSSDVEHATAIKLKAHLIAMLNWLNTHYNLSNFN